MILAIILNIGIVYAQDTTQNNCPYPNVCYTVEQDKRSIECFIVTEKKDALIGQYIRLLTGETLQLELTIEELKKAKLEIEDKGIKIKKKNKDILKAWLVAVGVGVVAIFK